MTYPPENWCSRCGEALDRFQDCSCVRGQHPPPFSCAWTIVLLVVILSLMIWLSSHAYSADWITAPSYYTHKDGAGHPVSEG